MAVQGLGKWSKFPCAHVPGEEQDTLAATARRIEIFESVHDDDTFNSFSRVLRKLRKFASHPSYLPDHSANHAPASRIRPIGKREPEIEHCGTAKRPSHRISSGGKTGADKSGGRPRQKSQQFQSCPCRGILERFLHRRHYTVSKFKLNPPMLDSSRLERKSYERGPRGALGNAINRGRDRYLPIWQPRRHRFGWPRRATIRLDRARYGRDRRLGYAATFRPAVA